MDQQQFASQQSQPSSDTGAARAAAENSTDNQAGELQVDFSQMDFQTIKAASDTIKVSKHIDPF